MLRRALIQKVIGLFLAFFSLTMLPPMAVSAWFGDGELPHFGLALLLTLGSGVSLWLPVRRVNAELRTRDGFVIVALFWTVEGMLGGLPFMFGPHLSFTDSVFEAISGFTTTGATVIVGLDQLPPSILYFRQQLQFFGGMGIVLLGVAIFPMLGVGGMQLYRAETPGPFKDDKLTPRISHTARALWLLYVGLNATCALAFWAAGMSLFDAVGHAFATISTGGFSTHDASLGHFKSPLIEGIADLFMIAGALNFAVHFSALRGLRLRNYWHDAESRASFAITGVLTLLVVAALLSAGTYGNFFEALRYALFQVISIISSTGFTTADYPQWPGLLPLALMVIAFIGGSAGSTAGGIKVLRIMALFRQGMREFHRLVHPSGVMPVKVGGKPLPERVIESIWAFFSLYMLSTVFLTLGFVATGLDPISAFGAVAATLNDMGPGLGQVAYTFKDVSDGAKWIAVFAMLLGRLEIFTLLILVTPVFWRR